MSFSPSGAVLRVPAPRLRTAAAAAAAAGPIHARRQGEQVGQRPGEWGKHSAITPVIGNTSLASVTPLRRKSGCEPGGRGASGTDAPARADIEPLWYASNDRLSPVFCWRGDPMERRPRTPCGRLGDCDIVLSRGAGLDH